jgi:D-alanyl-D-alanine carboxypeptidase
MSINPQTPGPRAGTQPHSPSRARRSLAVVVVLAATLSAHAGSVSAAAAGSLASPGAAAVAGSATATGAVAMAGSPTATGAGAAAVTPVNLGAQPGVAAVDQAPVAPPRVLAKAVILADEATGQVLYERNAGSGRAMASTTKVMTALLALERLDERKVVIIGSGPPKVRE